ncbi:MAG: hypothetical protein MHMPM18_002358 [Marteilia pararefringens]
MSSFHPDSDGGALQPQKFRDLREEIVRDIQALLKNNKCPYRCLFSFYVTFIIQIILVIVFYLSI